MTSPAIRGRPDDPAPAIPETPRFGLRRIFSALLVAVLLSAFSAVPSFETIVDRAFQNSGDPAPARAAVEKANDKLILSRKGSAGPSAEFRLYRPFSSGVALLDADATDCSAPRADLQISHAYPCRPRPLARRQAPPRPYDAHAPPALFS